MDLFTSTNGIKRAKIPMMTKWDDIMVVTGADWNPIKSAEFMGKPFGSHKIKITPASTSGMVFGGVRDILVFIHSKLFTYPT